MSSERPGAETTEATEPTKAKQKRKALARRAAASDLSNVILVLIALLSAVVGVFVVLFMVVIPAIGFDASATFAHSLLQVLFPVGLFAVAVLGVAAAALRLRAVAMVAGGLVAASLIGGLLSGFGVGSDAGIGNVWSAINRSGHERRIEYIANLDKLDQQRPDYDERIALDQAAFVIRRSLAGVVGDISAPTRVDAEWCSYITTAAEIRNRWLESVVCVNDEARVRRASFPLDVVPSVGLGFRRSELANIVAEKAGSDALFTDADVYGYIAEIDGALVARLVVPIGDRRGLDLSKPVVPDGVVLFGNNADGNYNVEVRDDVSPGSIPGPVAGLSSAERIRESINDSYGFLVSERPSRSALALQGTGEVGDDEIDESDPNFGNASEFVLQRDGVPYAVTPLTSFGSASTITAYLEVRLDTVTAGVAPEATLYRLPEPEAANTTLTNTIRVLYGQDLAEADRIYEVTPSVAGSSRITIGREDQVRFVARSETEIVSGELVGEICVESRTGAPLDCSPLNDDPRPLGTLVFDSSSRSGDDAEPAEGGDTGFLVDVPLADLLAEIERRVNDGS